jgi:chemotaxis protein CheD
VDNQAVLLQSYLKPGDIYISEKSALISMHLSSCVSVTMSNPRMRAGAICDGLLPSCKGKMPCECEQFCREGIRFVDCSNMRMLGWFKQNGIPRGEIDVKVFGGPDMFSSKESISDSTVGQQNITIAFHVL